MDLIHLIAVLPALLLLMLITHVHNWEKISVSIAKSLPPDHVLPCLGIIDSWARKGSVSRLKPYLILTGMFFLSALVFIPWYRPLHITDNIFVKFWLLILLLFLAGLTAGILLIAGVAILTFIFPNYNSDIYRKAIINKLIHRLRKSEGKNQDQEARKFRLLIEQIRKMEKPIVKPRFIPGKGSLSQKEMDAAAKITVWLVWYDDRFEWYESEPSSFLACVCTTKEDAEAKVRERPYHEEGNIGDGFEMTGPYNLLEEYNTKVVSADQVRQLLSGQIRSGPN